MTVRRTTATSGRVLGQLRNDPRTIALLLVVPSALMGLLAWIVSESDFDQYGPPLLGIFPLVVMFLVTSVATLRERTSGTLERLLSMPLSKSDFIFGYALAFGALAALQALIAAGLSFGVFGLDVMGSPWLLFIVAIVDALLGTAMGLFLSAFAVTEFQAVQFMPAFILPQLLLCGIITPRDELPTFLEWVSAILPMSYAVDATTQVVTSTSATAEFWRSVAIVAGFMVVSLGLGAATLRRRTP
ncbi:MAG TPA: ABC transporter permease [Actinomycetes bacterium]|nr:ABC transporter permease [Actinomycetes bacterium]